MRRLPLTLALVVLCGSAVVAQQRPSPEQGAPPNLGEQDGHWTANNAPEGAEDFEVYVVAEGDTLWALAERLLNDPFLWPQLWETNEHIVNPHWIYPEDKILIRPLTRITEAEPPQPPAAEPEPEPAPEPEPRPIRPVRLPATPRLADSAGPAPPPIGFDLPDPIPTPEVKAADLYCSGFVTTRTLSSDLNVMALFPQGVSAMARETDYVYVSEGSAAGIEAGQILTVVRPTIAIRSPRAAVGALGMHYLELGQLRVVLVQSDFSLARVINSCDSIEIGDTVVGFRLIDFPELPKNRPFSPTMPSSGKITGAVAMSQTALFNAASTVFGTSTRLPGPAGTHLSGLSAGMAADGQIVYIDLGNRDGVRIGDIFLIYRPLNVDNSLYDLSSKAARILGTQRQVIGELIVLKVEERAATAIITFASDGVSAGDFVELR